MIQIQSSLENYNSQTKSNTFIDINLIFAEIKLIKCKYENLSIDISINNFIGLSKLILLNFADLQFSQYFENNQYLFRRTLLLIKAWCLYEGCIVGSNVGLLASYAVEVLVIYLFNNFHKNFKNELEAFVEFFKVIKRIDWDNFSICIEGFIPQEIIDEEKLMQYLSEKKKHPDQIFKMVDFINFFTYYEKYREIERLQAVGNKNVLNLKFFNILDPLCVTNNIGRSVNFHNFSKIKKVFEMISRDLEYIIQNRNKYNPFNYLNMLLRLFKKILSNKYSEIFFMTLPKPKIIIVPNVLSINDISSVNSYKSNSNSAVYDLNSSDKNNKGFSSTNDNLIKSFNKKFANSNFNLNFIFSNKEDKSNIDNTSIDSGIIATNEIIEYFIKRLESSEDKNSEEEYITICIVDEIENFIRKLLI